MHTTLCIYNRDVTQHEYLLLFVISIVLFSYHYKTLAFSIIFFT